MARRKGGLTSRLINAAIASRLSRDEETGGMTLPNVRLWLGDEAPGEIDVPRRLRQPRTLHLRPATQTPPSLRKATLAIEIPPVAQRKAGRALARRAGHRSDRGRSRATVEAVPHGSNGGSR